MVSNTARVAESAMEKAGFVAKESVRQKREGETWKDRKGRHAGRQAGKQE